MQSEGISTDVVIAMVIAFVSVCASASASVSASVSASGREMCYGWGMGIWMALYALTRSGCKLEKIGRVSVAEEARVMGLVFRYAMKGAANNFLGHV